MTIEIEATYEDGVLKLDHPLPFAMHQRVKVTVQEHTQIARQNYGIIGWQGDSRIVEQAALDPASGISESP